MSFFSQFSCLKKSKYSYFKFSCFLRPKNKCILINSEHIMITELFKMAKLIWVILIVPVFKPFLA